MKTILDHLFVHNGIPQQKMADAKVYEQYEARIKHLEEEVPFLREQLALAARGR